MWILDRERGGVYGVQDNRTYSFSCQWRVLSLIDSGEPWKWPEIFIILIFCVSRPESKWFRIHLPNGLSSQSLQNGSVSTHPAERLLCMSHFKIYFFNSQITFINALYVRKKKWILMKLKRRDKSEMSANLHIYCEPTVCKFYLVFLCYCSSFCHFFITCFILL